MTEAIVWAGALSVCAIFMFGRLWQRGVDKRERADLMRALHQSEHSLGGKSND